MMTSLTVTVVTLDSVAMEAMTMEAVTMEAVTMYLICWGENRFGGSEYKCLDLFENRYQSHCTLV